MLVPPFLKPKDSVAVVAPARKVSRDDLAPALQLIKQWGLKPILGKNLFNDYNQFAGTDTERLSDLQEALDDPRIKAVFCARGGYGTSRIIDEVRFDRLPKHPKWIVGFSDITILHCRLHGLGIQSLHAPMPIRFTGSTDADTSTEELRKILFGENIRYTITPSSLNILGKARGQLIGGNLTLLHLTIGTSCDIDTEGKILFIEDLDEYLYHIDRMMVHMKRAGKLAGLAGMLVGGMNDMHDNPIPFGKTAYEIIRQHTEAYGYPVCFNVPAGHELRNVPLRFGATAVLNVTKSRVRFGYEGDE